MRKVYKDAKAFGIDLSHLDISDYLPKKEKIQELKRGNPAWFVV